MEQVLAELNEIRCDGHISTQMFRWYNALRDEVERRRHCAVSIRRDILAAVAMHGMVLEDTRTPAQMAHIAYEIADAMVEESKKEKVTE